MDIELAKTFLVITRLGSFIAAAEQLNVTQTAVTARIRSLESQLNCTLFIRNRAGAQLTENGQAFLSYANQLLQTWEAAQRDLPLLKGFSNTLRLGAEVSLSSPLMLDWVHRLQLALSTHMLHISINHSQQLLGQLEQGLLDAALLYQPSYASGLQVEQLLEEKLILVRSTQSSGPYIYVDWGEHFRRQHDQALPENSRSALTFDLGPSALKYVLTYGGSGYFRARVVQHHLQTGLLEKVAKAPEFTYPIYLVYPRERDNIDLQQAFKLLREAVLAERDWSAA